MMDNALFQTFAPRPTSAQASGLSSRVTQVGPFQVEEASGELQRLSALSFHTVAFHHHLLVARKGSAIFHAPGKKASLQVANSISLIDARDRCEVHFGRGSYDFTLISWQKEDLPALEHSIDQLRDQPGSAPAVYLTNDTRALQDVARLLFFTDAGDANTRDALITAMASLTVYYALQESQSVVLAEIPLEASEPLHDLLVAVKEKPEAKWALKEAADRASYSAFHLSRTFRTMAPYGFPVFVDRARTEKAIQYLLETNISPDEIAERCGFGSNQRLRASLRDHVGFLPSELRRHASRVS